jgi:hypothetical protein
MRINTIIGRLIGSSAAIIALVACDQADAPEPSPPTSTTSTLPDADLDPSEKAASAAPIEQSCPATSYCSGPLVVKSDILTLNRPREGQIEIVGTLSFENRSGSDVRLALLDEQLVLNTTKGISAVQRGYYTAGLGVCRDEGSACFDSKPDTFRLIAPGDSPAKLNVNLTGSFEAPLAPMVAQVETGTLTLNAYAVAADGARQLHRISLANVPITNQVTQ